MSAIRVVGEVEIPLRDGTKTFAELWLPDDGRPHPAVLVRTPYLKELAAPVAIVDTRMAVARGYAVVLQDVRGRGTAEGTFEPFVHEQQDGVDSVAWTAAQEWCDGDVVMAGMSYVGATQWLAAAGRPSGLRAIAPTLSSDDYGEGWSFSAGVPELGFLTSWSAAELAPSAERFVDDPARAWRDLAAAKADAPWLDDWLTHGAQSAYWRERSVAHRRDDVAVPALITGGWYDIFLSATLRSFARSRDPRDRLILGPWGHGDGLSHLIGAASVGIAGLGLPYFFEWLLDFYDAVLAGHQPAAARVRAYALGAKRWVDLDTWPPPHSDRWTAPLEPGTIAVHRDAPVPTHGGRGLLVHMPGLGFGIADQRPLLGRDDVHVALRATLDRDLLLAGPATARLITAARGNGDRLWVATLCVEQPDAALHNLAEGVAAAPDGADTVDVALGDTFTWLPAGSTLVLLVSGSSFPRWPAPVTDGEQQLLAGSTVSLTVAPSETLG